MPKIPGPTDYETGVNSHLKASLKFQPRASIPKAYRHIDFIKCILN